MRTVGSSHAGLARFEAAANTLHDAAAAGR
jgi:hypothetical protein